MTILIYLIFQIISVTYFVYSVIFYFGSFLILIAFLKKIKLFHSYPDFLDTKNNIQTRDPTKISIPDIFKNIRNYQKKYRKYPTQ